MKVIVYPRRVFAVKLTILSILFSAQLPALALAQDKTEALSSSEFASEISALIELLELNHPNLFWLRKPGEWNSLVSAVKEQSGNDIGYHQQLIQLLKLVAFPKDGHTKLNNADLSKYFGYAPYNVEWFENSLHIVRTSELHADMLGAEVLQIGDVPIAQVRQLFEAIVPYSNEGSFRRFSPRYFNLPGLLYGLGISDSPTEIALEVQKEGGTIIEVSVAALQDAEREMTNFVSVDDQITDLPLHMQNPEKNYWFSYLSAQKTVYVNFRAAYNMDEENIWQFTARLSQFVTENAVDKFIVDIRNNGGGNGSLMIPLYHAVRSSPMLSRPGKVFVITSPWTFSAAIGFLVHMDSKTPALIVGEAAGGYTNSPGDNDTFQLPNSGMQIDISRYFHVKTFTEDIRTDLRPDLETTFTYEDYAAGMDRALEAILNYDAQLDSDVAFDETYVGMYAFSPDKNVRIYLDNDVPMMEISKSVYSRLYPNGDGRFKADFNGLSLQFFDDRLVLMLDDQILKTLSKLQTPDKRPIDFIYEDDYAGAEQAFVRLKSIFPDLQSLKDNNMAMKALLIYYDARDVHGREIARARARAYLNIAILINEESSFSQAALEYY